MKVKLPSTLLFVFILGYFGHAISGTTSTEEAKPTEEATVTEEAEPADEAMSTEDNALVGDSVAGEARYNQTCKNCHGTEIGPNSSLMIMMAKPLTDQEIADLATYLKDATNQ